MSAMRSRSCLIILSLALVACGPGFGQSLLQPEQNNTIRSDTVEAEVARPFPINQINTASANTITLLSRMGNARLKKEERTAIETRTDSIVKQVGLYIADTIGVNLDELNFRELEIKANMMVFLGERIEGEQRTIDRRLSEIQANRKELEKNRRRWDLTHEQNKSGETPEAIVRRIGGVRNKIDSVAVILQNDIDFLLTQSDRLTGQQIRLDQFGMAMEELEKMRSSRVFQRDMPPIWLSHHPGDTLIYESFWGNFRSSFRDDTKLIIAEYSVRLITVLVLFVLLLGIVFWLRSSIVQSEIREKRVMLSLYLNEIFRKPVEVSLLLALYLLNLIIPEVPTSYSAIVAIVAAYAILRIAIDILPSSYRRFLVGIAVSFVLLRLYNLFYDQYLHGRLLLLSSQLISLVYLLMFLLARRMAGKLRKSFFHHILTALSALFFVFLFIGTAGNIIGALSLAEFLSFGIIRSTFLILITYVGFHVLKAIIYLVMSSSLFQQSNIIREQFSYLFHRINGFLRLVFVISWIILSLERFGVRQDFLAWGSGFLEQPMQVGKASFTLLSVILFVFVIWLSLFISRIVRHVLQEEVFPRVKIKRGVPGTITMLLRIALVSIGFLLAAAAAGIKLDSLAIILGAFSVGIGFGLQNIFNNLVSGLILAFERPIKAGDIVEVNNLLGTVKQIGIRSSVVKTFEGAEVIVPNGELISNDLINWTLSDQFRRGDIRVGVAYGTDPKRVTDLLLEVANKNPRVLNEPHARAYFIDFGDSSLNFRLLAWIDQDYRLEVESELRIEIDRALKEAGIEIPFPQRDLHVRSVNKDIMKDLGAR